MARERRRGTQRVLTMVPARIGPRHARLSAIQVLLADLSDSGAAIRYEKGDLPVANTLSLEFTLPGTANRIHCLAELVWQDYHGTGGLRFVDMPSVARQQLADWLSESQKASRKAASAKGLASPFGHSHSQLASSGDSNAPPRGLHNGALRILV
jgi:hypothetical protein